MIYFFNLIFECAAVNLMTNKFAAGTAAEQSVAEDPNAKS
jgi:hypothetical protein